jgi:hypothetical protein
MVVEVELINCYNYFTLGQGDYQCTTFTPSPYRSNDIVFSTCVRLPVRVRVRAPTLIVKNKFGHTYFYKQILYI